MGALACNFLDYFLTVALFYYLSIFYNKVLCKSSEKRRNLLRNFNEQCKHVYEFKAVSVFTQEFNYATLKLQPFTSRSLTTIALFGELLVFYLLTELYLYSLI